MGLYGQIQNDIVACMKSQDKDKLSTLRLLKGAIMLYKINNKLPEVSDEIVMQIAAKQVKTHKESIIEFERAGRNDLIEGLKKEISILETFLPESLSDEEVKKEIEKIFDEIKPNGKADLGKVMKEASTRLKGKADFKLVSEIVQSKLQ